jgi:hypothetical protein
MSKPESDTALSQWIGRELYAAGTLIGWTGQAFGDERTHIVVGHHAYRCDAGNMELIADRVSEADARRALVAAVTNG